MDGFFGVFQICIWHKSTPAIATLCLFFHSSPSLFTTCFGPSGHHQASHKTLSSYSKKTSYPTDPLGRNKIRYICCSLFVLCCCDYRLMVCCAWSVKLCKTTARNGSTYSYDVLMHGTQNTRMWHISFARNASFTRVCWESCDLCSHSLTCTVLLPCMSGNGALVVQCGNLAVVTLDSTVSN
jgi:hypothetical protein